MELKNKIVAAILGLVVILFVTGLFKNIAYPLLWNDEAETAMYAKRVLEYGYPKVSDGKNDLYCAPVPRKYTVREDSDAFIATVWGHFYFCAPVVLLADKVGDIYLRTAMLRVPFALAGLAGLMIMALAVSSLWKNKMTIWLLFLVFFALFELLSVPLILHLRQVRYSPLTVLLSGCIFYAYIHCRVLGKKSNIIYVPVMSVALLLLYNIFPVAYFVFSGTIGLHEIFLFFERKRERSGDLISGLMPLVVSFVPVVFLMRFFRIFTLAGVYAEYLKIPPDLFYRHILTILSFLRQYELLGPACGMRIALGVLWIYLVRTGRYPRLLGENAAATEEHNASDEVTAGRAWRIDKGLKISNLMSLFFILYILLVTRAPLNIIYERYFIVLQPVLIMILLLDIFTMFDLMSSLRTPFGKMRLRIGYSVLICFLLVPALLNKEGHIRGYIYELTHRYRGPLDFIIPYIKDEYKDPGRLVIATNYEEGAYMYYLDSKVIVGYGGGNLREDAKMSPDVIVIRREWPNARSPVFRSFFRKARYGRTVFPVSGYWVNNIPQTAGWIRHQYRTRMTDNKEEQLEIYIKKEKPAVKGVAGEVITLNERGIDAEVSGDLDRAISLFNSAVELDPDYAESYNNLGYAYYKKGDLGRATEYFEKVLEIDPDHEFARTNLEILRAEGRKEE